MKSVLAQKYIALGYSRSRALAEARREINRNHMRAVREKRYRIEGRRHDRGKADFMHEGKFSVRLELRARHLCELCGSRAATSTVKRNEILGNGKLREVCVKW